MRLNGNIPNINLGLTTGVIGLLVFTIIVGGYYITQVKDASEYNQKQIQTIKDNQDVFTITWLDAQKSKYQVDNATINLQLEQEKQLLNLSRTNDKIIQQQLENQHHLINISNFSVEQENQLLELQHNATAIRQNQLALEEHILGNLTGHIQTANETKYLAQIVLDKQLANEKNIIGNLTNHRIIANISYDNNSKALSDIEKNQEAIIKLLNNNTLGR